MAAGYAACRPAVHARVIQQAFEDLGRREPFRRALDVGCGAGLSTKALAGFAAGRIGLEPAHAMLRLADTVAPCAQFIAGTAELIPLRDDSVDLITAAGSLNYADLDRFFPEAARVLATGGVLVVYDFSAGKSFRDTAGLDEWFADFCARYPAPTGESRDLSPAILARLSSGFHLGAHRHFEIGLPLTRNFYVDYMLTETNVASAVRRGTDLPEIRSWCEQTLARVWRGAEREVLFRGYFACMEV